MISAVFWPLDLKNVKANQILVGFSTATACVVVTAIHNVSKRLPSSLKVLVMCLVPRVRKYQRKSKLVMPYNYFGRMARMTYL